MQNRIPGGSLLLGQLTHQAPGLMWDAAGPERWHMQIDPLDHLVLTVADTGRTCEFYRWILGFEPVTFADNRKALLFGRQKSTCIAWAGNSNPGHGVSWPVPQTYALSRRRRWTP
jgi:hypothetical protein